MKNANDTSNNIHPTAIVEGNVELGNGNTIGAYSILRGNIKLGNNNYIGEHCLFTRNIEIGNNNRFEAFVAIGALGEMGAKGDVFLEKGKIIIGDGTTLREYVNVHSPVRRENTRIGNKCYIMNKVYIAHDCQIGDGVMMSALTKFGGGVTAGDNANFGMGAAVHQWTDVGESVMVGMNAAINKHIPPFVIVAGAPSRILRVNKVGLTRRGYSEKDVDLLNERYSALLAGDTKPHSELEEKVVAFITVHEKHLNKFRDSE